MRTLLLRKLLQRKALIPVIVVGAFLIVATAAFANHPWNGYHFPSDNLSPTVADKTRSSLYNVPAAVQEWADLGTPIQPTTATGKKGDITVSEAFSLEWLGLAQIWVEDGHITKGQVKLNTQSLAFYEANGFPGIADHALCQELGHIWGLDHNRDGPSGGTPDNTCMNDEAFPGSETSPNQHDTDQLNLIYNHTDDTDGEAGGGNGGGGGGCPPGNPNHPKCNTTTGVWITVHVFPFPEPE